MKPVQHRCKQINHSVGRTEVPETVLHMTQICSVTEVAFYTHGFEKMNQLTDNAGKTSF